MRVLPWLVWPLALSTAGCFLIDSIGLGSGVDTAAGLARYAGADESYRQRWGDPSTPELSPARAHAGDDVASLFMEAVAEARDLGGDPHRSRRRDLTRVPDLKLIEDRAADIDADLDHHVSVLATLDPIGPDTPTGDATYSSFLRSMPPETWFYTIVDLLTERALLSLAQGRNEDALADVHRLLAISRSFAQDPETVTQLHRVHLNRQTLGIARELLAGRALTGRALDELRQAIEDTRSPELVEQYFRGDLLFRLGGMDMIAEELEPEIRSDPEVGNLLELGRLWSFDFADRWLRYAATTPHLRGEPPEIEIAFPDARSDLEVALAWIAVYRSDGPSSFVRYSDLDRARRTLADIAMAVERFAMDHGGAYPESLEELCPRYLATVPIDPFTGEAFAYSIEVDGYRLRAEAPAPSSSSDLDDTWVLDWSQPRN